MAAVPLWKCSARRNGQRDLFPSFEALRHELQGGGWDNSRYVPHCRLFCLGVEPNLQPASTSAARGRPNVAKTPQGLYTPRQQRTDLPQGIRVARENS